MVYLSPDVPSTTPTTSHLYYIFQIKPRKSKVKQTEKVENVEATLKVKSPEEKAIDEEIEKLLHESDGPTTPTSPVNPIRSQKRREPDQKTITNLFDHEM